MSEGAFAPCAEAFSIFGHYDNLVPLRLVVMIDGGHLRALAKRSHAHTPDFAYTPDFIVGFAQKCVDKDETLLRCLYYDCRPFNGRIRLPISGTEKTFTAN